MKRPEFDREKFKRLVHYVIWRAGDRDGFGATKLYKVLWFSEARAFMISGKPISGAIYVRQKYGPVPKLAMPIREELSKEGAIRVWRDSHYNREITRFKALKRPDTSVFTADELKTVDSWIKTIVEDHTAESISEQSHDYAWEIAGMGEELPYHAVFAERIRESNTEERKWIAKRVKELGLP
jgi:hypothetical protein